MSTGTSTILHFTILPVQPIFWHRGASSTGTCAISHFTTLPCQPTFWHRGASFCMSTGWFWHVDGHIYYIILYTLLYSPVQPTCWHRGASFWHVDGVILACRRAHLLFYTLLFSLANQFFGIAGHHFGMSTGTSTILHFTIPLSNLLFLHCGASFWHVDGHIYYLILYYLPFQRTFWHPGASFLGHLLAVAANQLAMSMGRDTFRTVSKHCANAYSWIPVFIHVIQRQKQPQLPQIRGLWFRVDKRKLFLAKNKKQKKHDQKPNHLTYILTFYLTYTLAFYLAHILTFSPTILSAIVSGTLRHMSWHSIWHIVSHFYLALSVT